MSNETQVQPEFVTRKQLSEWLQIPYRWLNDNSDIGPPYYKLSDNTVRYRMEEVEDWLMTRRTM
jgi:predicted DNA-binding transcriptional regulator AlpA